MAEQNARLRVIDQILREIIDEWYERVKENYVTEEDSQLLGVEPEIKRFADDNSYRVKFARKRELDITYGLAAVERDGTLFIESSVNNKSDGFDYDLFIGKLQEFYWKSKIEKAWTDPEFDRFAYGDLIVFEPRMGTSVKLDVRKEKADIIRLYFKINSRREELLMRRTDVLRDLIENYCLTPLKRIFAETYREPRD